MTVAYDRNDPRNWDDADHEELLCPTCGGPACVCIDLSTFGDEPTPSTVDAIRIRCDELIADVFARCSPETRAALKANGIVDPSGRF